MPVSPFGCYFFEWECDADMCTFFWGGIVKLDETSVGRSMKQILFEEFARCISIGKTEKQQKRKNLTSEEQFLRNSTYLSYFFGTQRENNLFQTLSCRVSFANGAPRLCFKKVLVPKEAMEEMEGESEAINLEVRIADDGGWGWSSW